MMKPLEKFVHKYNFPEPQYLNARALLKFPTA